MTSLLSYIQTDLLAFIVLVVLLFCAIISIIAILKSDFLSANKGWYYVLFIIFSFIGFVPALDLMTTSGYTKYFAIIIFVILLTPIIVAALSLVKKRSLEQMDKAWNWFVLPFIAGGLLVSGYLTHVELTSTAAVCGVAIPGCGEVQSSSYAVLFGFLPVALLGVMGYIGILIAWLGKKIMPDTNKSIFNLSIWGLGFFGIMFSIYLTYLEVFVLRATCSWCILAAVFMILLFWISIQDAQEYFMKDQNDVDDPA
jgi:uncharacterized membrane protein